MSSRAHMSYILAVLKYLTCLVLSCLFDIDCPISSTFEKLNSKNPYIESFILFREVFRTHVNIYEIVFVKKN